MPDCIFDDFVQAHTEGVEGNDAKALVCAIMWGCVGLVADYAAFSFMVDFHKQLIPLVHIAP